MVLMSDRWLLSITIVENGGDTVGFVDKYIKSLILSFQDGVRGLHRDIWTKPGRTGSHRVKVLSPPPDGINPRVHLPPDEPAEGGWIRRGWCTAAVLVVLRTARHLIFCKIKLK